MSDLTDLLICVTTFLGSVAAIVGLCVLGEHHGGYWLVLICPGVVALGILGIVAGMLAVDLALLP